MELSLNNIRERVEPFLVELWTQAYRALAGLPTTGSLRSLYAEYPELCRAESVAIAQDALGGRNLDEDGQRRLQSLVSFLSAQVQRCAQAPLLDELTAALGHAEVALPGGGTASFSEAQVALRAERDRGRRDLLEKSLARHLQDRSGTFARAVEAGLEASRALGPRPGPQTSLQADCATLLRQTEDAWRDVLGYALRKVDPELRPLHSGDARRHDLERALATPWLAEHLRPEDGGPALQRSLEELGFHPSARGRVQLDTDVREGRTELCAVAPIRVPDDVRVVMRRAPGLDALRASLSAYGQALAFAHTTRTLPVEERRLGDGAVRKAAGALFEGFAREEKWHKRYLRLPGAAAQDAARLAAFSELAALRRWAAQASFSLELWARGPSADLLASYPERLSAALFVVEPRGSWALASASPDEATESLRAAALGTRMTLALREKFDEDFWRNPAAGRHLEAFFAEGVRRTAEEVYRELGGQELSLPMAGEHLVALLDR